jgi:hypothetical protein
VISPWREIESNRIESRNGISAEKLCHEERLLEAKDRQAGLPLEEALEKLGI